ncbi:hypothetical protein BDW02DRAFT_616539 [Decorospora gaudefroyi]|uniref:Uncharacterized protein n=1 Tax=Decorospora gaudefroyi TaxID=184978 RepID=A0A6A5KL15_9PLEO|nr:hypothetical protein BDW02DRAFT_616539 [Decorospora gaudefroyi]
MTSMPSESGAMHRSLFADHRDAQGNGHIVGAAFQPTVQHYQQRQYGGVLRFPNLAVENVGTAGRPRYLMWQIPFIGTHVAQLRKDHVALLHRLLPLVPQRAHWHCALMPLLCSSQRDGYDDRRARRSRKPALISVGRYRDEEVPRAGYCREVGGWRA